jgi:hypothetical protein
MPHKTDYETKKTQNKKEKTLENVGLAGAAAEVVQRYESANKEILIGGVGVDNETGKVLSKSLESISKSKINPDYKENNINQQSGFSAEVQ